MGDLPRDKQRVKEAVIQIATNAAVWSGIERAITAITCVPGYLAARKKEVPLALQAGIVQLIRQTEEAVSLLHDQRQSGYQFFFSYSLVAHWSYFEAFIEDYIDLRLEDGDLQRRLTGLYGGPKRGVWNQKVLRSQLYVEGEAFSDSLRNSLEAVDVPEVNFSDAQRKVLNFSNSARNCLLHNAGVWNERGCTKAGLPRSSIGTRIELDRDHFLSCYDVVSDVLRFCDYE